jgi:general secretion pathway protein A
LIGGLLVLLGAALAAFALRDKPQPGAAAAAAKPVTAAAQASASAPVTLVPVVPRPIEEAEALLVQLPRDIDVAWRELAPSWKLPADQGNPCQTAAAHQVQCYRAANLSVPLLRQLARPGILTLQAGKEPPVYALLVGLGDQTATLRVGTSLHTVNLVSLARLWRGDFATYWRAPPDYRPEMRDGSSGAAVDKLASQLALLDGTPARPASSPPQVLDAALRERVRAFQRSQGLKPDGQPGPLTFMQIDSATASTEPRLQTEPR